MYATFMRTTIDLPDDLHQLALSIARDTHRTLSETVADLMRRGLRQTDAAEITRSPITGLPTIRLGKPTTAEDVWALEDPDT